MLIQHKGKRYAVKITEIESQSENAVGRSCYYE